MSGSPNSRWAVRARCAWAQSPQSRQRPVPGSFGLFAATASYAVGAPGPWRRLGKCSRFTAQALRLTAPVKGFVAMLLRDFDHAEGRANLFADCPQFAKKIVLTRRIVNRTASVMQKDGRRFERCALVPGHARHRRRTLVGHYAVWPLFARTLPVSIDSPP